MTQCEKELSGKLEEIQQWQEKDKQLLTEFSSTVGGTKSEFYAALLKLFKKKVKRAKVRNGATGPTAGGANAGNAASGASVRDDDDDNSEDGDDKTDSDGYSDGEGSSSDDVRVLSLLIMFGGLSASNETYGFFAFFSPLR